jgi:hypothetical protein
MLTLTNAIEMVVEDTRENTSPDMTVEEIVEMVRRDLVEADLDIIEDPELRKAYDAVREAGQGQLDNRMGLIS